MSVSVPNCKVVINGLMISLSGFLYMSDFLHQWLTATQYVAPLMANFDTQIGNDSQIHYADNGKLITLQKLSNC